MLFSQAVADKYREVSASINAQPKKDLRARSLKGIIQESFFHGASFHGANFIA